MSALAYAAVLALAGSCQSVVAPEMIVKIAKVESGFDPSITHRNTNGSTDYGLMQINDKNFDWLGLTKETALDPCVSIGAAVRVLTALSRYNTGDSIKGISNGYAGKVMDVGLPEVKPAVKSTGLHNQFASFR